MRLVINDKGSNELLGVVCARRGPDNFPLFEVGVNHDDAGAWPLLVNVVEANRHFFLTRKLARDLAHTLLAVADDVDVRCRRCAEVEDAKIHDRQSRKWEHDYDEQAL